MELTTHLGALVVVSCYMRHSVHKEVFVGELRRIMDSYPADSSVIIGTDANSKSSLWGSPITDRNGLLLEDFIAETGLTVLNEFDQGTFRIFEYPLI